MKNSLGKGNSSGAQRKSGRKNNITLLVVVNVNRRKNLVRSHHMFVSSENFKKQKKKRTKWRDSWITYTIFIGVAWIVNFNLVISLGS